MYRPKLDEAPARIRSARSQLFSTTNSRAPCPLYAGISPQLHSPACSLTLPTDFSRIQPQIIQTFGAISFYLAVQIFKPSLKRRMQEEIETEPLGMRDVERQRKRTERGGKTGTERGGQRKREREGEEEGFVAASYIPCGGRVRTDGPRCIGGGAISVRGWQDHVTAHGRHVKGESRRRRASLYECRVAMWSSRAEPINT